MKNETTIADVAEAVEAGLAEVVGGGETESAAGTNNTNGTTTITTTTTETLIPEVKVTTCNGAQILGHKILGFPRKYYGWPDHPEMFLEANVNPDGYRVGKLREECRHACYKDDNCHSIAFRQYDLLKVPGLK